MILDTSFLLDHEDGDPNAFEEAVELHAANVPQRISVPSVMELHYGATFTSSEEERRRVRNLLMMYPLVDLDESAARTGGELLAKADRKEGGDSGVDNEDGLIGAVAALLGEPVLTAKTTHFEKIGVETESY